MHLRKFNVFMRSKAKFVLAVVCVVIMFVWFVPMDQFLGRGRGHGGKIFGKSIPAERVETLVRTLRLVGGASMKDDRAVYAQAWETLVLNEEAARYGIRASDGDVTEFLKRRFGGSTAGLVDEEFYRGTLDQYRLTRGEFEDALREIQTGETLKMAVIESVSLPDNEAWLWYSRDNEQAQASYVLLKAESLSPLIPVTEETLQAFYQKYADISAKTDPNGIGYEEPKRIKIEYITAPFVAYIGQALVTEREIAAYYEAHKAEYVIPSEDAEKKFRPLAEVSPLIEVRLQREEAERLATEAIKDVDQAIGQATETEFGSTEVRDVEVKTFAEKFDLPYAQTEFFSADEAPTVLPGATTFAAEAFKNRSTDINDRRTTSADAGKLLYRITAIQKAVRAPYEKVSAQVVADYRRQEALALASELASQAATKAKTIDEASAQLETLLAEKLKAVKEDAKLDQNPKSYFTVGQSEYFTRPFEQGGMRYQFQTGLEGNHGDFANTVFALKDGEVGTVIEKGRSDSAFIVARTAVNPADNAQFESNHANVQRRYLSTKRQSAVNTWLADVMRRAAPSEEVLKSVGPSI